MLKGRCCASRFYHDKSDLSPPPSTGAAFAFSRQRAYSLEYTVSVAVSRNTRGGHVLFPNSRRTNSTNNVLQLARYSSSLGIPGRRKFEQPTLAACLGSSISSGRRRHQDEQIMLVKEQPAVTEEFMEAQFVRWFRGGWPYIQGLRSNTFVIVIAGEVTVDDMKMDGILQDILLLHGLGVKLVIIPGTHAHIDQLLTERGHQPQYSGEYRVTDAEALAASMEAAGRVRVAIEAKLSRGPSIPILRRHGDSDRRHTVSIASGNFLAAKRRGVVNGIDFSATGEVKRIDITRIQERLDNNCIVMLNNLGYSASGEVLNCNTYEVATACAVALQADKMVCLLDGPILDNDERLIRFMTLPEADKHIHEHAGQSSAAANYVKSVARQSTPLSPGHHTHGNGGADANGASNGLHKKPRSEGSPSYSITGQKTTVGGFAIGGDERLRRTNSYLSELTAAVFACRNGVMRVHLLDSNVQGVLLLELYTRDGIGTMVSSDMYEGTRPANNGDILSIMELLRPLEESGVLVNRPREQLEAEFQNYTVVERDSSVIACAALIPYHDDKCGEVAAFAVSPECRGSGLGDSLLDYIEKRAIEMKLRSLFLLTTRTADWFIHRGFSGCTVDQIPKLRREKIDYKRGAKYYEKTLDHRPDYHVRTV